MSLFSSELGPPTTPLAKRLRPAPGTKGGGKPLACGWGGGGGVLIRTTMIKCLVVCLHPESSNSSNSKMIAKSKLPFWNIFSKEAKKQSKLRQFTNHNRTDVVRETETKVTDLKVIFCKSWHWLYWDCIPFCVVWLLERATLPYNSVILNLKQRF